MAGNFGCPRHQKHASRSRAAASSPPRFHLDRFQRDGYSHDFRLDDRPHSIPTPKLHLTPNCAPLSRTDFAFRLHLVVADKLLLRHPSLLTLKITREQPVSTTYFSDCVAGTDLRERFFSPESILTVCAAAADRETQTYRSEERRSRTTGHPHEGFSSIVLSSIAPSILLTGADFV